MYIEINILLYLRNYETITNICLHKFFANFKTKNIYQKYNTLLFYKNLKNR